MSILRTLAALVVAAAPAVAAVGGTTSQSLVHDAVTRTYRLHVPASLDPARPVPLVVAFHYLDGTGALMEQLTGFSALADAEGFIVAYPDGIHAMWDIGQPGYAVDDVGFVDQLVDVIEAGYAVDVQRVYATGMSNGAYFTSLLALRSPQRFAAVAPVAGDMLAAVATAAPAGPAMPLLMIRGTADPVVAYAGSANQLGADGLASFWVARDHCATTASVTAIPDTAPGDGCTATERIYATGDAASEVLDYVVDGGGHAWPGHDLPHAFGPSCEDFDATTAVWAFFARHALATGGTTTAGTTTAGTTSGGATTAGTTTGSTTTAGTTTAGTTTGGATTAGTSTGGTTSAGTTAGSGGGGHGGCGLGSGSGAVVAALSLLGGAGATRRRRRA